MGRFLNFFKPISRYLPEIKAPEKKVGFGEKLFWTGLVLVLFLVMGEISLYGLPQQRLGDPLGALRVIFASKRGTLMELGIGPIVTAGLILQLLVGSGLIEADLSKPEDRGLFTAANKFFAILMTTFEASAYLISGAYGNLKPDTAFFICLQLVVAGVMLILLDELVQKGWGIGSGISLFIAAGVAQTIWWDMFAPIVAFEEQKSFGAVIAFIQSLLNHENAWEAFIHRPSPNPTMLGLVATIAVFLIVIYIEGMRVEIPVAYAKFRGYRGTYPLKLLYVSNIPVILASALFADLYFVSQILWSGADKTNPPFWIKILGEFNTENNPVGGLAYYMTPPRNLDLVAQDPLRAVIYVSILVLFCVIFAVTWVQVGGLDSKTVAKQLVDSGMQIPGFRRSERPIQEMLDRYIPAVTVLGAIIVGLIAASADFLGVFGTGMGVLLTVGILYQYYQLLVKERLVDMYPALGRFLGK